MTLQASGAISINDIAVELGISNAGLNLNDSRCRNLAGIASGAISLSNFYGKSNYVAPAARTLNAAQFITNSSSAYGYSDGTIVPTGSASDNNGSSISNYTFLGQTIKRVYSNTSTTRIDVSGSLAQNAFNSLQLNGLNLITSGATWGQFSGTYGAVTYWSWPNAANIVAAAYTLSFT